jgi:2-hydroxy-6-oxonona-2,4-dienedioate hydrolase
METRRTTVAGLDLFWRELGTGDPLVFVHGIGISGKYLLPTAERLAPHVRALVPDLPGTGRSRRPPRALGVGGTAGALHAWLDAIGIERASFLGNSMGCQTIVRLAAERPERVDKLVLVGPTVDPRARALGRQILRLARDAFQEPVRLVGIAAWDYVVYGPLRLMQTGRSVVDDAIEVHAPNVAAPTLVVRGEHDPLVPQAWAEELTALLPDGRLEVVAGAPHAVNYTAADQLAALTLDFLNDRRAGPSD